MKQQRSENTPAVRRLAGATLIAAWLASLPLGNLWAHQARAAARHGRYYASLFEPGRLWVYLYRSKIPEGGSYRYAPLWLSWCVTTGVDGSPASATATWSCQTSGTEDAATTDDSGSWVADTSGLMQSPLWGDYPQVEDGPLVPHSPRKGFRHVPADPDELLSGRMELLPGGRLELLVANDNGAGSEQSMTLAVGQGPVAFSFHGGDDMTEREVWCELLFTVPPGLLAWVVQGLLNGLPKISQPLPEKPERHEGDDP